MSPGQAQAHGRIAQMPLTWGGQPPAVALPAATPAQEVLVAPITQAPVTIWLMAALPGGAQKAARPGAAGGDGGGGNGTDPAACSSGAAIPLKRPAASVASALAAARNVQAPRPSTPAVASATAPASKKRPAAKRPASAAATSASSAHGPSKRPATGSGSPATAKRRPLLQRAAAKLRLTSKRFCTKRVFTGRCQFPDAAKKGRICGKRCQTIAKDGNKYCKHHASVKDKGSGTHVFKGVCPVVDASRPDGICGLQRRTVATTGGDKICKRHAAAQDGKASKAPRLSSEFLWPVRFRLRGKQPGPIAYFYEGRHARCRASGCCRQGHIKFAGLWYCCAHAREQRLPMLAHMSLEAYTDASVPTHHAGLMTETCKIKVRDDGPDYGCGALHFAAERTKAGRFSLCCLHGKLAHIGPPKPPPKVLEELLTSSSKQASDFRQEFFFVSGGWGRLPCVACRRTRLPAIPPWSRRLATGLDKI